MHGLMNGLMYGGLWHRDQAFWWSDYPFIMTCRHSHLNHAIVARVVRCSFVVVSLSSTDSRLILQRESSRRVADAGEPSHAVPGGNRSPFATIVNGPKRT